ncbi:hypothetical protein U0X36_11085 [Bacillus thuringiensis]|uniref:hypothetical protein n=1 Tax=Bacillus thuringiensis TaxID=1428 RepID=UPI000E548035|nr:hypothetical protein [Bacillus thuringiensis]MDZ3953432.1 hypothetical protein [Bacillus thuringiensis]RGP42397.1 hypothetical protein BTW32_30855 [Bacillus thuringiensis]
MKLYKIITAIMCFVVLAACSVSKEEYIEAIAKVGHESGEEMEKASDKSLSFNERKEHAEKAISLINKIQKINAPSEFKEAHEDYKKYSKMLINEINKMPELTSKSTNMFNNTSEKDLDEMSNYSNSFEEKLGENARNQLHEKNRDYRRITKEEYISIVSKELKAFLACFKDDKPFAKDKKSVQALMRQAQEHLDKVLTAIPPKELEEENIFRKAGAKLWEATDILYFDPTMEEEDTLDKFNSLYHEGIQLHNEFMEKLLKKV